MNFLSSVLKFALFILIALSCNRVKVIEIKNDQGVLIERITTSLRDTGRLKDGFYEKFDELGRLLESANYKDGKLDGERKIYEKGLLYSLENYKMDLFDGPYKVFYPNGQLQLECQYINNEMSGTLKAYYPGGQLKEIVQMNGSQENGPFEEYYENGKIKAQGSYKNGPNEEGLLNLYDSLGTLIKKMNCKEGICSTIWSTELDSTKTN
ncbi:MAG TPA: toxin-antitoxin system YwqK family antitoxin [Saprospiraceae bacterium]|nr:toxin-antitoxin system YwqK family antitoxin [Saprospiraceae bacterium]